MLSRAIEVEARHTQRRILEDAAHDHLVRLARRAAQTDSPPRPFAQHLLSRIRAVWSQVWSPIRTPTTLEPADTPIAGATPPVLAARL